MENFELNKTYPYSDIENAAGEIYETEEHGKFNIGENFIVVKHPEKDLVCSFILTGTFIGGSLYTCIYNDWRK